VIDDRTRKIADKYIRRVGRAPSGGASLDATWRAEAPAIRQLLRSLKSQGARDALERLDRIEQAIHTAKQQLSRSLF
jgi:hypothetical protein